MANITISEFRSLGALGGGVFAPVPSLPEVDVTTIDTTAATTHTVSTETHFVIITSDTAGKRVSGIGALSGSILGVPIPADDHGRHLAVTPGSTLHFTDDS